jgi:uncharacterized membrane protein YgdD (TMEM256/DUF423 family)
MTRLFWLAGAIFAGLGVAAGAFATHGLKSRLSPDLLQVFETGARYQIYHALGLLVIALASERLPGGSLHWAGWLFIAGTILFSGSLYALCLTGFRIVGAITPIGGLCFLAGWILVAWEGIKR